MKSKASFCNRYYAFLSSVWKVENGLFLREGGVSLVSRYTCELEVLYFNFVLSLFFQDDAETIAIREKVISARQKVYTALEEEVRKRWPFEEAIKRPYFHVKPLERVQLKNWREYLDFELSNGDHKRVVILFERCVIACALYEDFWQRFATYMEGHSVEACRHVYERACTIHLPRKPSIQLAWAAFEEQQGD